MSSIRTSTFSRLNGRYRCRQQQQRHYKQHGPQLAWPSPGFRHGDMQLQHRTHAAAGPAHTTSSDEASTPWQFGFQMNERYLLWDDAAAGQLIKMVVAQKMQLDESEVEDRLQELGRILPDLLGKLERMKPDILTLLLADVQGLTAKLLNLREQLPGINISSLVAKCPFIVLDYDTKTFNNRLESMRQQLPGVQVEQLIAAEPMLLKADLQAVLQNSRRLLPNLDPVQVVAQHPQMILDMTAAGMLSAIDVEGIPSKPPKP